MLNKSLLQKSGLATLQVAQILAGLEPGERIPTVTELSEQCDMARGNIQIALNNLKQNGIIQLESHGQNGTIATDIDYLAMAQYCSNTNLTCVMPMPYFRQVPMISCSIYRSTMLYCGWMTVRGYSPRWSMIRSASSSRALPHSSLTP